MKAFLIKHSQECKKRVQDLKRAQQIEDEGWCGDEEGVVDHEARPVHGTRGKKRKKRDFDDCVGTDIYEMLDEEQISLEIANGDKDLENAVMDLRDPHKKEREELDKHVITFTIKKSNSCYLNVQYKSEFPLFDLE